MEYGQDRYRLGNTGDIDIAQFEKLSVALEDQVDPGLAETFSVLKFAPWPGSARVACGAGRQRPVGRVPHPSVR